MATIKLKTSAGTVELPKLTLKLSDMTDEVERCTDNRERYSLQLDFLREVVPADILAALLDGEELDEIDLVSLTVAYTGVIQAYAAPVIEEQTKSINDQLKAVQPALAAVERVNKAAQSRQGFAAVR